ncbi:hypothetical protein TCE0_034f10604 [Talaromyces pinophilus]|uniref:Pal1 cell morphology protein n=1 Tax=Talaromyces pinophilus TaxID=128442 RepID=A0A6V8HCM4_TALPI|nr:hypothetical protein DPV78_002346 [Talaromyces pinophilus]GAM39232.1 hypothetical protein TCE0_034f10604 [Talaromyces pinophilus]
MSLAPLSAPEHKPAQLSINLGSNNPFRNRAVSPSSTSPISPGPRPERPRSTNPFLDNTEIMSPQSAPAGAVLSPSSEKHPFMGNTAELFENLSLNSSSKERRPAPPPPDKPSSSRPSAARPSTSRPRPETRDRERNRDQSNKKREEDPFDIFADPPKKESSRPPRPREGRPRPRRNSESSIMERPKAMDPEDERRRRERRHRERERERDGKPRSKRAPGYRLDVIDKLDVTSIFGTGLFHHDGPFDACNPNRNRKGSKQAPMQAFPKDSKNMALGGAGPNNSRLNLELIHGHTAEGYLDYSSTGIKKEEAFDSARAEIIHGTESMGLGTSTFLEGTPASRAAIQRRQSESDQQPPAGGLQRTKSLAQKFKGINRTGTVRVTSPDSTQRSPASAGAPSGSSRAQERNPFFQDYDEAYDAKTSKIDEARIGGRNRASSSPRRATGLERKTTNGSIGAEENRQNVGGFMNRMKSLRRPRPERRVPSE